MTAESKARRQGDATDEVTALLAELEEDRDFDEFRGNMQGCKGEP